MKSDQRLLEEAKQLLEACKQVESQLIDYIALLERRVSLAEGQQEMFVEWRKHPAVAKYCDWLVH